MKKFFQYVNDYAVLINRCNWADYKAYKLNWGFVPIHASNDAWPELIGINVDYLGDSLILSPQQPQTLLSYLGSSSSIQLQEIEGTDSEFRFMFLEVLDSRSHFPDPQTPRLDIISADSGLFEVLSSKKELKPMRYINDLVILGLLNDTFLAPDLNASQIKVYSTCNSNVKFQGDIRDAMASPCFVQNSDNTTNFPWTFPVIIVPQATTPDFGGFPLVLPSFFKKCPNSLTGVDSVYVSVMVFSSLYNTTLNLGVVEVSGDETKIENLVSLVLEFYLQPQSFQWSVFANSWQGSLIIVAFVLLVIVIVALVVLLRRSVNQRAGYHPIGDDAEHK